ncbi:MAG: O-antigen ligase family protein [Bacteroidota bacterium]
MTNNMFYGVIATGGDAPTDRALTNIITAISYLVPLLLINKMNPQLRMWYFFVTGYMVVLMLESYYTYGTLFIYPHVFAKISKLYLIFFIYTIYKKYNKVGLKLVIYTIIIFFISNMILVNSQALSVSSFTSHQRGLAADEVYFLLLPCLYFFNKYLFDKKQLNLILFFVFLGFIIFFQHRTVWMSTMAGLILNLILTNWRSKARFTFSTLIPIAFYLTIGSVVILSFVFAAKPEIFKKLADNVSDIQNYKSQGTGSWRYEQFLSYLPYIEENILIGMRFQGFELPIQFYQQWTETTEVPVFEDMTGHHIHSNYIDTVFYFGLAGLLIFYIPFIIYFFTKVRKKKFLTTNQVVLLSFCTTIFVFSYSYTWPFWSYALVGLLALILERDIDEEGMEEEINKEPTTRVKSRVRLPV